jgi:formylglycine-generating enzyme required for sulfatase activity
VVKDYPVDIGSYQGRAQQTVTVDLGGNDQSLDFKLPVPAELEVQSQPSGLNITIDNSYQGQAPFSLKLAPESYRVELDVGHIKGLTSPMEGQTVSLQAGEKQTVWFSILAEDQNPNHFRLIGNQLADLTKEIRWQNDGAQMALIPAGSFDMRSIRRVELDAFCMDIYLVTNARYGKFIQATGHKKPAYWDDSTYNQPNQPVVGVDWHDAAAYCQWVGKRLPTEAEWEYAARGGLSGKNYAWGDDAPTDKLANYDNQVGKPTQMGKYPANGYGLHDMAGNVWEWCADWYTGDYYRNFPAKNPQGPKTGKYRVLRGGSWNYPTSTLPVSYCSRYAPGLRNYHLGFRCVSGLD